MERRDTCRLDGRDDQRQVSSLDLPYEPAGCAVFDSDGDHKIDLADLVAFQAAFTGTR